MQKPRPSDDVRTFSKITLLVSALHFFHTELAALFNSNYDF